MEALLDGASFDGWSCLMGPYSMDALSRFDVVASTIGEITPFTLTLTQAVLPLAMARLTAGMISSRRVISSPWPPSPSNMV